MSAEFDRKIHTTLADANLQLAIYTATGRLKDRRSEAVAPGALPDYQELLKQYDPKGKFRNDFLNTNIYAG